MQHERLPHRLGEPSKTERTRARSSGAAPHPSGTIGDFRRPLHRRDVAVGPGGAGIDTRAGTQELPFTGRRCGWRRHFTSPLIRQPPQLDDVVSRVFGVLSVATPDPLFGSSRSFDLAWSSRKPAEIARTLVYRRVHLFVAPSHDPSFPSDHATAAFALAVAVFAYHRRAGWLMIGVASVLAIARVAVGTHYPGDVVGGALLGTAVALLCVRVPYVRKLVHWSADRVGSVYENLSDRLLRRSPSSDLA